jgi:hypothetical protein
LTLIGCNQSGTNQAAHDESIPKEGSIRTFDLKKLSEVSALKLSDLGAIDIQYIPLSTNSKTVIPQIEKLIFSKSYFLTKSIHSINMFRYDGSFVAEIGKNGRGPDEYASASDVDVDPQTESIYIGDGTQSRFLVYSKSGALLRTFESPQKGYMSFRFTRYGIMSYFANFHGNIGNSYLLIDTNGVVLEKYPNHYPIQQNDRGFSIENENIFYVYNDQLYKKEIYSDTVFLYNDKVFVPHLIIDAGELSLSTVTRTNANDKSFSDVQAVLRSIILPINLFEFNDFLCYHFGATINGRYGLFSFFGSRKYNLNKLISMSEGVIDDIDGGPSLQIRTTKDANTLISWIDAFALKNHVTSETFKKSNPKYSEKKKELINFVNNLKETDNPVLVMVRLKK